MILWDRYAVIIVRVVVAGTCAELSGVRHQDTDGQHSHLYKTATVGDVVFGPFAIIAVQLLVRRTQ